MLLDTEDVIAEARNIRGVLGTGGNFRDFLYSLLRYGPMYEDWESRLQPTPEHLKEMYRAKDDALANAEKMVKRLKELQPQLPPQAYEEFNECFQATQTTATTSRVTHNLFMTMWALRQGELKPTTKNLADLQQLITDYARVMAQQPQGGRRG